MFSFHIISNNFGEQSYQLFLLSIIPHSIFNMFINSSDAIFSCESLVNKISEKCLFFILKDPKR